MRLLCPLMLAALFLSPFSNDMQAQPVKPKLNQMELDRQFLGTWRASNADGTTTIECKSFYNGVETYFRTEKDGKIVVENKLLLGYDKETDKLIECGIGSDDEGIVVYVAWFTSRNRMEEVLLKDIANPDKAKYRAIFELTSPNAFVLTTIQNGKITDTSTFHRVR